MPCRDQAGVFSSPPPRPLSRHRHCCARKPRRTWTWRSSAPARQVSRRHGVSLAANRRFVLLEATNRLGGRCVTDTAIFGAPFDLGAHWIHRPDGNPPGGRLRLRGSTFMRRRVGRRFASVLVMRAMQSWKRSFLPWCARAAPSWMPAERGRTAQRLGLSRPILATGERPWSSCSDRLSAARILRHFRLWILRVCWSATTMLFAGRATAR